MAQCECGGKFIKIDGLEGCYCDKCNNWVPWEYPDEDPIDASALFNIERIKAIRGVPLNEICIGSETKGRVKIAIPAYATSEEAKAIISMNLDLLQYTKNEIEKRNMDIYTSRGKKEGIMKKH